MNSDLAATKELLDRLGIKYEETTDKLGDGSDIIILNVDFDCDSVSAICIDEMTFDFYSDGSFMELYVEGAQ